jgi:p-aminobenzoyl-glutamate transporter AbgT
MRCVACAWCHRDWVNGDVYFWNTISQKSNSDVTRYLADCVREMGNYFYVVAGSGYLIVTAGQRT